MANAFIAMCYAAAKKAGVNTEKMEPTDVVEWYNKQRGKAEAKDKVKTAIKDYVDRSTIQEKSKEVASLIHTLKEIKRIKTKELVNYISSLKPINLKMHDDEIIAEFDKFTADKNIYSKGNSDDDGYKYKLSNIRNLSDVIQGSEYSHSKTEIGKNTRQHKGVKEWHYFVNQIDTEKGAFNIAVNVRDKGEHKFVYEVSFKKKKT